mmetsp:Transcript_30882/g.61146  ORF Transcript_30882/g.61146 Transcript_30882/m.61146 type:complete len:240 (-) Transcript_30882:81-800(-)
MKISVHLTSVLFALSCSSIGATRIRTKKSSKSLQDYPEVSYKVVFKNKWSAKAHSPLYPSSAHWSSPVVASHNKNWQMWEKGKGASEGVEIVAETGSTSKLKQELNAEASVHDHVQGPGFFNSVTQQVNLPDLTATTMAAHASSITMVAPSPDWFTGFDTVALVDGEGNWFRKVKVIVFPFDAGTDSGTTFSTGNVATKPRGRIMKMNAKFCWENTDGVFLKEGKVKPVGVFTLQLKTN